MIDLKILKSNSKTALGARGQAKNTRFKGLVPAQSFPG